MTNDGLCFVFQFPISFAIDFSCKSVKKQLEPQCAVPSKTDTKEKDKDKSGKAPAAASKQSDEADTGRLAVSISNLPLSWSSCMHESYYT